MAGNGGWYAEYLASDHWRAFRQHALDFYKRRCQLCNSTNQLNVHHRDYSNLGAEELIDVIVLCQACHEVFHRERKVTKIYGRRWATERYAAYVARVLPFDESKREWLLHLLLHPGVIHYEWVLKCPVHKQQFTHMASGIPHGGSTWRKLLEAILNRPLLRDERIHPLDLEEQVFSMKLLAIPEEELRNQGGWVPTPHDFEHLPQIPEEWTRPMAHLIPKELLELVKSA